MIYSVVSDWYLSMLCDPGLNHSDPFQEVFACFTLAVEVPGFCVQPMRGAWTLHEPFPSSQRDSSTF
jgi:hypothetical protein